MKNNYLHQIYYDMRHQPVISIVSITGTALAIFFVMVIVTMNRAKYAPMHPEDKRDRALYESSIDISDDEGSSASGSMSKATAQRLFFNLENAEAVTLTRWHSDMAFRVPGKDLENLTGRTIDDGFFKVFNHDFIAGEPLSKTDSDAGRRVAIINQSTANKYFGSPENAIGKTVEVDWKPYLVIGVVKNTTPLAEDSYGEVFIPYNALGELDGWASGMAMGEYMGSFEGIILAKSKAHIDNLRKEIRARKKALQSELKAKNLTLNDHGGPFTSEIKTVESYSNVDPDFAEARRTKFFVYLILLLIPAINLNSMTRGRLRYRMSEMGIRRAFGAKRSQVVISLLIENFIITLIAAAIGLLGCVIFAWLFSGSLFESFIEDAQVSVPLGFLLDWRVFGFAIAFSFVLNLLSAGIPAWKASRVSPVNAINNINF